MKFRIDIQDRRIQGSYVLKLYVHGISWLPIAKYFERILRQRRPF